MTNGIWKNETWELRIDKWIMKNEMWGNGIWINELWEIITEMWKNEEWNMRKRNMQIMKYG